MKFIGIYQIQSKAKPERIYIGSASDIPRRWSHHLSLLKRNKHSNLRLQNHYNKYGRNDLSFTILIGCDKCNLIENEQFFIDSYKPWFNLRIKADSNFGLKHSSEAKRKIGQAAEGNKYGLGVKRSEVWRKEASERMKGNKFASGVKHTDEWKEANSKRMKGENHPLFGKKLSPERCKANGELKKGIKASANTKKKMSESGKRAWELRKLTLVNPN